MILKRLAHICLAVTALLAIGTSPALAYSDFLKDTVRAQNTTTKDASEVTEVVNAPPTGDKPAYVFRANRLCESDDRDPMGPKCAPINRPCSDRPGGYAVSWEYRKNDEASPWELLKADDCVYPGDPLDRPGSPARPAFSITEFRSLPLRPAKIVTQPGRHTLKGAYTNIYADVADQSFSPRLAGKVISVRAHPSSFAWKYGDGTTRTFTIQGGPLRPDQAELDSETRTSHVYAETGDYNISVTTTYTGEYSVDGGPWIPIIGTAQVNTPAVPMSVWRTETHLYAENCIENPQGAGCPGSDR